MPAIVPRYCGAAISIKYRAEVVVAKVEKNDRRKRPQMKAESVGAVDVTIVPMITPKQPMKMRGFRPSASADQMKNAPHICPTLKMANTIPVPVLPSGGRP